MKHGKVGLGTSGLMLLLTNLTAFGEPCSVRGTEAVHHAKARGFEFAPARAEGSGTCTMEQQAGLVVASVHEDGVTCTFKYFGKLQLSQPWKIAGATFRGADFTYEKNPAWNSGDAELVVRVLAGKGGTESLSLAKIVLEGGNCSSWQDAFSGR